MRRTLPVRFTTSRVPVRARRLHGISASSSASASSQATKGRESPESAGENRELSLSSSRGDSMSGAPDTRAGGDG